VGRTAQAFYYLITGLWPVLHIKSFEKITGPKTDKWLVKMVGLLAAAVGVVIFVSDNKNDLKLLGGLSAASFMVIDFYYAAIGRISKVYWLDGIIQTAFFVYWFFA
jgi:hypothetical protein